MTNVLHLPKTHGRWESAHGQEGVSGMTTLSRYTTTYVAGRRARGEIGAGTAANHRYSLDSLDLSFGSRPISQLTPRAIEHWLETVGHLSPATRRNHLSTVRGFCRWMVREGHLATDPTKEVATIRQPRSVPRAMPKADVARLWRVLPDDRAKVIVSLMLGCGLRCVEVSRLETTDYDPDAGTIIVVGKGGHQRILPVPGAVARAVDRYIAETGGATSGPLVRSSRIRSRGLSAETISTYVSRWMEAAGIKHGRWDGRSAHALRHTAASDVLDACRDLRIVQAMLGHEHLSTTAIYLRRADLSQMRHAMEGRDYSEDPPLRRAS